MIRLTRRYSFPASHRLHSGALSDLENREIYGKCNNPYGHGHNYVFEITVSGPVHPYTGQIVRVQDLDELVQERVLADFSHCNLNADIPEFRELVPTSENVALVIQARLNQKWKERFAAGGPRLDNVRLLETERNRFELRS